MHEDDLLSVVVPAFNEEDYIGPCLDALLNQTRPIDEIIVVDNASTDSTADIVDRYRAEFHNIRLVSESSPGVAHARNSGFDSARGSVIGRIDADTRVRQDWAECVCNFFQVKHNEKIDAITGLNNSYDSPYRRLKGLAVGMLVKRGSLGGGKIVLNLHGANMALRRSAWHKVRDSATTRRDIHEDLDLALCLFFSGSHIAQLSDMWVDISPRRALTPPIEYIRYSRSGALTYQRHNMMNSYLWRLIVLQWCAHAANWLFYRAYDPHRSRFSLTYLTTRLHSRDQPVAPD